MRLGKALKSIREAKGLKLGELASTADISTSMLSLIESGDREPSLGVLRRLAEVMAVPMDALIALAQPGEGSLRTKDSFSTEIISALRSLEAAESKLCAKLQVGELKDAAG